MKRLQSLEKSIKEALGATCINTTIAFDELSIEIPKADVRTALTILRDTSAFACEQLIDLCAVDYLHFGVYDWETEAATESGFSRGVERQDHCAASKAKARFAVVYHLMSIQHNHRIRVKVFLDEGEAVLESVHDIWKGANWFEREAYDFYGILFKGHPDLRRILTDYGFIGHPFRKDFPLSGHVEMRYDARTQKVIYEPVEIEPRTLVPKVIRTDNRYLDKKGVKYD